MSGSFVTHHGTPRWLSHLLPIYYYDCLFVHWKFHAQVIQTLVPSNERTREALYTSLYLKFMVRCLVICRQQHLATGTRVLNISEILNIILAAVEQPTTLAHLTQCYKLFLQPAPENLWRNVPDVAHIVWLIRWVPGTPVSIFRFISRPSV